MGSVERPRRVITPPGAPAVTGLAPPPPVTGGHVQAPGSARELYRTRPDTLLHAQRRLDAALGEDAFRETADWLRQQYLTGYGTVPIGFVAQCFLGPPYVDHRLSLEGRILDHFAATEPMPEPFGAARMLARSGAYAFIEVYDSGLILPVLADGNVVRP
jgi:hypothetical protein